MIDTEVTVDFPVDSITARTKRCLRKIKPMIKLRIIKDCNANVPLKTGALRNSALRWAPLTNDYIVWDTPYAHFQHTGKVMIGETSHSPWV